jgi:hypothetical protein
VLRKRRHKVAALNSTLILRFEWLTQHNRCMLLDRATLTYSIYDRLLGERPIGSKVSPF